jgi:guanine deaminase
MAAKSFALKGDIIQSRDSRTLDCVEDGYLVCEEGRCTGVFAQLPERFKQMEVRDFSGRLIIPGLIDLHTHAPQFAFRGRGMDLELLDWLNTCAFPEEARYENITYAAEAYRAFADALTRSATTRAVIFGTIHPLATLLLMDMLEHSGLATMVGKVNMDRNAPPALTEPSAKASLDATRSWIEAVRERGYSSTFPLLTPRFIPSCSDELLRGLSALQKELTLPVQSHLSENDSEIAWVRELRPDAVSYADAYLHSGLLGGDDCPTIMAHCVHSDPLETPLLLARGVWIAHCPVSNTCLSSGIAPARTFLDAGLRIGLGTDVAGGYSLSMLHSIAEAIKVSKLRWHLVDDSLRPLTVAEAFYLATRGGGSFWGKVGGFDEGFDFDAVVIRDTVAPSKENLSLQARLERLIYTDADTQVTDKYVAGKRIPCDP